MEPPIIEQIITEFFAKTLHIILESRSPSSPSPAASAARRDKWFNLALRDCPAALQNFHHWRQSNLDPLVIDITQSPSAACLVRTQSAIDPLWPVPDHTSFTHGIKTKIIERWVVQYDAKNKYCQVNEIPGSDKKAYKRSIVLLRSLYATVRLLPAYRVFRGLNTNSSGVSLSHRISSFVEPFTRAEDAEMRQWGFTPVDTPCGRLSISVMYLPKLEMGVERAVRMETKLIADYVGSPTTDRVKRFTRRHSWSIDRGGVGLLSSSPSDTSATDNSSGEDCRKITGFDQKWPPPPPVSLSPSPSPPAHFRGGQLTNAIQRADSALVSVSLPQFGKISGVLNHGLPPSSSRKVTKAYGDASPDNKLRLEKKSMRFLEFQTDSSLQKVLSIGSSNRLTFLDEFDDSELAFPFAADDEDLIDSCNRIDPSGVKDQETGNTDNRGLFLVKTSPDAAIGALVRMFKAAPSLQRNIANSDSSMQASMDDIWNERIHGNKDMDLAVEKRQGATPSLEIAASGLLKSKTAADAFLELSHYKEMKELLLRQGGMRSFDDDREVK